jgi:hypothetical protein
MPTIDKTQLPARPVESTTRVTIAFPFGSIHMGAAADPDQLQALTEFLADLTAQLDKVCDDDSFADLANRARELADAT